MTDWSRYISPPERIHLDLGLDHGISWFVAGEHDRSHVGAAVYHLTDKTETGLCCGAVTWAPTEWEREHPDKLSDAERNRPRWTLESPEADEHITISPSVLCNICGDHGFIRDGKWVPA